MTALLAEKTANLVAMRADHKRLLESLAPEASNRVICCAAHLVNYFERFQRWKQPRYQSEWIYQPLRKIRDDLERMYTIHTLRAAIDLLQRLGFLNVEQKCRNGQDKTHQYLLHTDRIELALKNSYTPQPTAETPEKSPFVRIEPSVVRIEPSVVKTEPSRVIVETSYRTDIQLIDNNNFNSLEEERVDFWDEEEKELPRQNILSCTEEPKLLEDPKEICDNKTIPGVNQFSAAAFTSNHVKMPQKPLPKLKGGETGRFTSQDERDGFYRELLELAKRKGGVQSPVGWASCIIKSIEAGEPCEYLQEYRRGDELGTVEKKEWEIEPGRPYPQLVTYVKRLLRQREDSEQQALAKAFRELSRPERAEAHWQICKRDIDRHAQEWEKQQALGVKNAYLPPELLPEQELSLKQTINSIQTLHANSIQVQLMAEEAKAKLNPAANEQAGLFPAANESEPAEEKPPALTDLQTRLETPFGSVVRKLIESNPEWGYQIDPELKLVLPVAEQPSLEHLQWLIDYALTSSRARKLIERNPQWEFLIDQDGRLWGF